MTSKRFARLVDVALSRLGSAVLVLLLLVPTLAFTMGLFPRTLIGTLVLIAVGIPLCVLGALSFNRGPRAPSARAGAVVGFIALLVLLWWWTASHALFMRQNFF